MYVVLNIEPIIILPEQVTYGPCKFNKTFIFKFYLFDLKIPSIC